MKLYVALWVTACAAALVLAIVHRRRLVVTSPGYRRFLCAPWKLATFVVAASGVVFIAPWTGDPTWDYVDGALMSVLAFTTDLLLRDGYYPVTWAANLVASSVLYLVAGLFWSLDTTPSGGWVFAFADDAWPRATVVAFSRILWPALLLMAVVTVMMVAFATGWTPR